MFGSIRFRYLLAGVHLLMVALYAGHFIEWSPLPGKATTALTTIGDYTGSSNIYSFFAPGLSNQPYVVYVLRSPDGKEKKYDFAAGNAEFANRLNNIYGYYAIPESRDIIAPCLARTLLNQQRDFDAVKVVMVIQYIPNLKEYAAGERTQWHFWFEKVFARDSTAKPVLP